MIPNAVEVRLSPEDRAVLEARLRAPTAKQRQVFRARVVLLAADGRSTTDQVSRRNSGKSRPCETNVRVTTLALRSNENRPARDATGRDGGSGRPGFKWRVWYALSPLGFPRGRRRADRYSSSNAGFCHLAPGRAASSWASRTKGNCVPRR